MSPTGPESIQSPQFALAILRKTNQSEPCRHSNWVADFRDFGDGVNPSFWKKKRLFLGAVVALDSPYLLRRRAALDSFPFVAHNAVMSQDDFDIDGLAQYLHLAPQQVSKMADRGKLPGRKIGGQWRFSQADIHHWLEDRIGVSDDGELAIVETALDRAATTTDEQRILIAELLPTSAIQLPLNARTSGSVIRAMTELAANTGYLWDAEKMAEAVRSREGLHPTALDNGVALLHPRRPLASILSETFIALGRTSQGIPFGGSRGVLTDLFFLICSTDDRIHLRVLARLSRLISDNSLLTALRSANDAGEVKAIIVRQEESQFPNS